MSSLKILRYFDFSVAKTSVCRYFTRRTPASWTLVTCVESLEYRSPALSVRCAEITRWTLHCLHDTNKDFVKTLSSLPGRLSSFQTPSVVPAPAPPPSSPFFFFFFSTPSSRLHFPRLLSASDPSPCLLCCRHLSDNVLLVIWAHLHPSETLNLQRNFICSCSTHGSVAALLDAFALKAHCLGHNALRQSVCSLGIISHLLNILPAVLSNLAVSLMHVRLSTSMLPQMPPLPPVKSDVFSQTACRCFPTFPKAKRVSPDMSASFS